MSPSEIAREALKRLATRKLAPTPANYQDCYNEIAGITSGVAFPEASLRRIALALKAHHPSQQLQLDLLDASISRHSWQGIEDALVTYVELCAKAEAQPVVQPATQSEDAIRQEVQKLLATIANMLDSLMPTLLQDDPGFAELARSLLSELRAPTTNVSDALVDLSVFGQRLSSVAEEQEEIRRSLLHLLNLVIQNVKTLVQDDSWLDGQVTSLLDAVRPPLSLRRLDDVERRIQDVIRKQAAARERTVEAQEEMRQMLRAFIERLGMMNESSTTLQGELEESARKIEQVKRIEDLAPLLKEVINSARTMADDIAQSRQQLQGMQEKVLATEAEIDKLHQELTMASAMARHDPLTNTLNRKGLDEAFARELSFMQRTGTELSIALLDIDNFKNLNDRLGHESGDEALVHLVNVTRKHMRPSDTLARYGGEEFVILLPGTPLQAAVEAMTRLQRALTKDFFITGNEKILITFSAGVAQINPEETPEEVLRRADKAMYLAKRSGKNRVNTA